jgi:outer membrane protein OmpA-like peptidoglycan-associated protein
MNRSRWITTAALGLFVGAMGCSSTMPRELMDARSAHDRAAMSKAPQYAPAEMQTADEALKRAEREYEDHGNNQRVRDFAYVAQRRAELASAYGDLRMAQVQKAQAEKDFVARLESDRQSALQRLEQQGQNLDRTTAQLQTEREARQAAERKTKDALDRLSKIASVNQENRGLVITLPSGVLFTTAQFKLLPAAQEKLNQVADALLQDRTSNIVVEGHTDSQGPDDANQTLSQKRAEAVREYLVSRGIAADRISAVGKGESQPIADNNTAENRALNRRVEIIVNPGSGTTPGTTRSTTPGTTGNELMK